MSNQPTPQKTIGLLGGCSNVATGEYYKFLNSEVNSRLGKWEIAETLISGMNFGNIESFVRNDDWIQLQKYMEKHINSLIAGGVDVILCASNTLHKPFEKIMESKEIPFIHIADPTGKEIKNQGLSKVILLGTMQVMQLSYLKKRYYDQFGLEIIVPGIEDQREIDRIIFEELVKSDIKESSRQTYIKIINKLVDQNNAQGVILGCTEIFLLLRQEDIPDVPLFNTTLLHCRAAVDFALNPD